MTSTMDRIDDEDCLSPISCVDSAVDRLDLQYCTPATSPATSPCKSTTAWDSLPAALAEARDQDVIVQDALEGVDAKEHSKEQDSASGHAQSSTAQMPGLLCRQTKYRLHRSASYSTPRSRRTLVQSIDYPDRFIPARSATPTKQALLLSSPHTQPAGLDFILRRECTEDPFLPAVRRSTRISERYATLRSPSQPLRLTGLLPSSVNNNRNVAASVSRAIDFTVSWTANGQSVTEGVASTTNRQGGRITSGSSAPHFCADLLRLTEKDQGHEIHERRLAVAMEVDQSTRMVRPGPRLHINETIRENHAGQPAMTTWKDNRWQQSQSTTDKMPSAIAPDRVSNIPFRVLDAPTLRDDFYCSLLAYCPVLDCLAVGLANHIYIWSEKGRRSDKLPESLVSHHNQNHVTTISFSSPGNRKSILAIGRSDGLLSLWHPLDRQPRFSRKHPVPISYVSFRPYTTRRPSLRDPHVMVDTEELLVGDDLGKVLLCSVEWPSQDHCDLFNWTSALTLRAVMICHSQQICGIAWSADGEQFATGGNDNRLFVFDYKKVSNSNRYAEAFQSANIAAHRLLSRTASDHSLVTFGEEKQSFSLNAAVKAIAFAPWQPDLLVAGGGSNDRCVHFFHIGSGARLATINCHAQVTSVVWNTQRRELAVTLGFAQPKHSFRVAVFAWPSCDLLASIPWAGEERALYAIAFPGGPSGRRDARRQTLVIATSDASIKFHEVWPKRKTRGRSGLAGVESTILNDTCSPELAEEGTIR